MTRLQLRTLVEGNLGRSDKSTLVNSAIDLALGDISTENVFEVMKTSTSLTLTIGSTSVALPSDFYKLEQATLINGTQSFPFQIRTRSWFLRRFPNVSAYSASIPVYGYIQNSVLYFAPKALDNYTLNLNYSFLMPSLTSDSDSTLTTLIDGAVVAYATYYIFKSTQNYTDSREWYGEYQAQVRSAIMADRKLGGIQLQHDEFLQAASPSRDGYSPMINPNDPFAGWNPSVR